MVIIRLLRTCGSFVATQIHIPPSAVCNGHRRIHVDITGSQKPSSNVHKTRSVSRIFARSTASVCFLALYSSLWCVTILSWRPSFVAAMSPRSWLHIYMQTESPPGYDRRLQSYAYQTSCFMTISHKRGFNVHIRPYAVPSTRIMMHDMISVHEFWQ